MMMIALNLMHMPVINVSVFWHHFYVGFSKFPILFYGICFQKSQNIILPQQNFLNMEIAQILKVKTNNSLVLEPF